MKKRTIICISREFGSGGHEISQKLADMLDIPCYDKRLIERTAKEFGESESMINGADEQPVNYFPDDNYNPFSPFSQHEILYFYDVNYKVFHMQVSVIKKAAEEGSCVIVGRVADEVLKKDPDMISIFVTADMEDRVKRVMDYEQSERKETVQLVKRMDKLRANYYNFYSENEWGECSSYDLSINVSKFGIEDAVAKLAKMLQ